MGKFIDMTGWVMKEHGAEGSLLTVLYYNGNSKWHCRCECGNETDVQGYALRASNIKSCGCLGTKRRQETNSLRGKQINIGDHFGKLTIIKDLGYRKQNSRNKQWRWSLCQCSCGSSPIEVANALLTNGHVKSCGCLQSYGEMIIREFLQQNNIDYKEQYSFPDLTGPNGGKLRFDFAIFENNQLIYLIEFDGKYHYQTAAKHWQNYYSLEDIQYKDKMKNEYCKCHNILLKRIPYTEQYNISYEDIISNKFNT